MRTSWVTTTAVGGVIAVLTLFLGLQYIWLQRASEAERERMHRHVETDTKNFADDFNRELQAAFFNFQIDSGEWERGDWTEFNERYDFWRSRTQYPELIRGFAYLGKGRDKAWLYDPETRRFAPGEIRSELIAIAGAVDDDQTFEPFYEEQDVLVMPVHETPKRIQEIHLRRIGPGTPPVVKMPERKGLLLILLDREVITGRILPDLAARHFPEGNFRVAVSNKAQSAVYAPAGALSGSDATAGLLGITGDNYVIFSRDRGPWPEFRTEKRRGIVVNESIESKTFTHTETGPEGTKSGTYTIQLERGPSEMKTRTSVFASSEPGGDPWTLSVQHVAGSIDAFARKEFNKSFAIGLGLYILLVGAIVAIVFSALRSKRFAQRQIDFVSSVSHEFRTPLAVIYSAGENLADGVTNDPERVARYGSLIKGEGRKLSAMVEQILQFAGARSGRKKYNFAPVDVAAVINAALLECTPILEEKGFAVETSIDKNLAPVTADADALATAVQNLISNAIKYSNGTRWIKVSASNGNGTIKLSVEDKGIGINAGDLRHVFEPFYRAKNVVDAQIHGNGIGLALVREIAEAHGGGVHVKSETGEGSQFTIELPVPSVQNG